MVRSNPFLPRSSPQGILCEEALIQDRSPDGSLDLSEPRAMDIKTLKLELLERIALIDDEARLLALKRLLDAPRGYGIPNEKLSVVKEEEGDYAPISVDELVEIIRRDLGK